MIGLFAIAMALAAPAMAHFQMANPVPIQGAGDKSPLDPSGSNFPCQGAALTNSGGETMAAGSKQTLSFNLGAGANTAVHGGGSCQISLSYETDPAKLKDPKNWHVIHSFIEGCPTNAEGNLINSIACASGNGGPDCVNSFDYEIPSEVKPGPAIFAWTWFNTIGQREMYMNCAAVTIEGGDDKVDSLPPLFVANLQSFGTCATNAQQNVLFPNPGKYVTKTPAASGAGPWPVAPPSGDCGEASGGSAPPSDTPAGDKPDGSETTTPVAPEAPVNTGGEFLETPDVPDKPVEKPVEKPADKPTGGSGACPADHVSCSADGFYCIDEKNFGLCANGCAISQPVAPGTKCAMAAIGYAKRNVRFPPQARRSVKLF